MMWTDHEKFSAMNCVSPVYFIIIRTDHERFGAAQIIHGYFMTDYKKLDAVNCVSSLLYHGADLPQKVQLQHKTQFFFLAELYFGYLFLFYGRFLDRTKREPLTMLTDKMDDICEAIK